VEPFFAVADDILFSWSNADIRRFLAEAERLGVVVPSTAVGVFNGDSSLVEQDGMSKAIDLIKRALNFSAAVKAEVMLLCTYLRSEPDTTEKQKNLLKLLAHTEPLARRLGICIALESPLPAKDLAQLVDTAASDHIGIYYDFGNAIALGFDPVQEIPVIARHLCAVHIKDSINKLGGLHLGRGHLDLPAAMGALKKAQYDGWLMLETPGDNDADVREDIKLMQQFV
jgi:sugar phosphate isomerase/epimerase